MGSAPMSAHEKERLKALSDYRISDADTGLLELTRLAAYICDMPIALISLIDADRLWFRYRVGLDILQTPRKSSFCDRTIKQPELLEVEDTAKDPRFRNNPLVKHRPHIHFYAGVPLLTPSGHAIGSLCVMAPEPNRLTASQRHALKTLADQVMTHLELIKAGEELKRATGQVEQEQARKARFLANMSHGFSAPISGLTTALQQLESEPQGSNARQHIRDALLASRHLTQIVDDIFDYSRIESNDLQLDCRPMELDNLLRKLAALLSSQVGDKPLDLWFDIDPDVPELLIADELRLSQVLLHLGENAVKFTEHGRVVIKISNLGREQERIKLHFEVIDTGIGISPEQQHRVFEAFRQGDGMIRKRFGGTGLGLAISRELVNIMGGELEFKSEYGLGARFYFTLHLAIPEEEVADEQDADAETKSPRVLIVSKSEVGRRIISNLCHTLGWSTDLANSGAAALSACEQETAFDAILIDTPTLTRQDQVLLQHLETLPVEQRPVCVSFSRRYNPQLGQSELPDAELTKPIVPSILAERFNQIAQARQTGPDAIPTLNDALHNDSPLAGVRLLLVEDNRVNATVATLLLETEGAQVIWKRNGEEAYRFFTDEAEPVDIVLMDLEMPVMDGFSATENIRHDRQWDKIPIVALGIKSNEEIRARCLDAGMQDCLDKPFDSAKLVHAILGQLKRR
ncbi:response regulator [Marinobacterium lutimaris]|uniref:histidine kinase n=1 Tax=Marinobacterium lutimaris TaxID=568106 RepID=A0A1H6AP24_9GAMM|nr:response regulator [Marinobacterium lutimaris]SEG50271.1 Signal transduction histidine kinase [Marinobacterium lutimaris]